MNTNTNTNTNTINLTINDITDIEFDGINHRDCPDYTDAFIASAWNKKEGRPCTEAELDYIAYEYGTDIADILWDRMN